MKEIPKEIKQTLCDRINSRRVDIHQLQKLDSMFPPDAQGLVTEMAHRRRMIESFVDQVVIRGPSLFHYLVYLCEKELEIDGNEIYGKSGNPAMWKAEAEVGKDKILTKMGMSFSTEVNSANQLTETDNKTVSGRVLAYLRKKYGFTQKELIDRREFPANDERVLRQWEKKGIPEKKIMTVAQCLGVPDTLFHLSLFSIEKVEKIISDYDN